MRHRWLPRLPALMAGLLALTAGACSLWVVFEQDIYWQIRAGDELWRTHTFPTVDTWSYSAAGKPWMNIQWLATLLLRGLYALGAEPALVCGRAALVALLLSVLAAALLRGAAAARPAVRCGLVALAVPALYTALWPRLQLRSDTLVMAVFAAVVALWAAPLPEAPELNLRAWRRRAAWSLAAVLAAANLHAGTAPFVVAAVLALLLGSRPHGRTLPYCAAALALFFCTPYGIDPVPLLWAHVRYYDHNILENSDQLPLRWKYMSPRGNAWAGEAWVALMGSTALLWGLATLRARALGVWRWRWGALFGVGCFILFTALSINRVRAIPYQLIFMLPLLARSAARAWEAPAERLRGGPWPLWLGAAGSLALAVGCVLGLHTLWGFGVHERLYPVGSVRFVERARPRGNVLHTFACGAYMVWHMRDYPLYVDTRETMFWDIQEEILGAYQSAEITQAMIRKYQVNTVLMPIPPTRYVPQVGGFEDVIASYMPAEDWALVYFDKITFVMVRRMPEHQALIAAEEYKILRPNLPANSYPLSRGRTPERDAGFVQELDRCLANEPESVYCLVAQATWWRVTNPEAHHSDAIALLERARAQADRWGSLQHLTLLVELESAYKAAGLQPQAAALAQQLAGGQVLATPARIP